MSLCILIPRNRSRRAKSFRYTEYVVYYRPRHKNHSNGGKSRRVAGPTDSDQNVCQRHHTLALTLHESLGSIPLEIYTRDLASLGLHPVVSRSRLISHRPVDWLTWKDDTIIVTTVLAENLPIVICWTCCSLLGWYKVSSDIVKRKCQAAHIQQAMFQLLTGKMNLEAQAISTASARTVMSLGSGACLLPHRWWARRMVRSLLHPSWARRSQNCWNGPT